MDLAWALLAVLVIVVGAGALAVAGGMLTVELVGTADPSRRPHCPLADDGRERVRGRGRAIGRDP